MGHPHKKELRSAKKLLMVSIMIVYPLRMVYLCSLSDDVMRTLAYSNPMDFNS